MFRIVRKPDRIALALVLIALILRVGGLDWGLPDIEEEALPMKKAFDMWGWNEGHLVLDPQTAGWPSLSFYVHLGAQQLQYLTGRVLGEFHDRYDYYVAYQLDPTRVMLWARAVSVLASLVVVWMGVRLGRHFAGPPGAIATGSLLAVSPLLVQHAQMVTPDILLTMFAALATDRLVRLYDEGRTRDYVLAAAFAGLGAACKYTPVLLTLSLYGVHLLRLRGEGRSLRGLGLDDRRLGYAALAAVLAFTLASPYTFLDLDVLQRDFAYQALHMSQGHFGHQDQGVGYGYYLVKVLPQAMGWPALVVALAGWSWAAWRRRGAWWALLLCLLPFYLVLGSLSTQFDRYMLPAILPLAVGLAAAVEWARSSRWLPGGRTGLAVGALLLAVLVAAPARQLYAYQQRQSAPSTEQLATEWFLQNVDPETATVVKERYTGALPDDRRGMLMAEPVFQRLDDAQRNALLDRPFFRYQLIPMYAARVELSAFYYDLRHYLPYDYIVTSGSVQHRYEADPDRFAEQVAFYADLERFTTVAARFAPGGVHRGPEVRIHHFSARDKARLVAERRALEPGFYRAWTDRLHAPHFLAFVENVALHAQYKEMFDVAWTYYEMLLETCPADTRLEVMPRTAYAALRSDRLEEAESLYLQILDERPRHAVALGNLGFVREKQGRLDEARELYSRCIEVDPDGAASRWAQSRLAKLGD